MTVSGRHCVLSTPSGVVPLAHLHILSFNPQGNPTRWILRIPTLQVEQLRLRAATSLAEETWPKSDGTRACT